MPTKKLSPDEFMNQLEKALRPPSSALRPPVSATPSELDQDADADAEEELTRQELVEEFDDPIKNGEMQTTEVLAQSEGENGAGDQAAIEEIETPTKEEEVMKKLIAQVQTKHRQLMYRIIAGESEEMICREMGIAQNKFKILTNSPLFKTELDGLRKKLQERLLDKKQLSIQDRLLTLNSAALRTLVRILTADKGVGLQLKRQVAKDIIDYNLKLTEAQNKGSYSETAGFIMEAFGRAEKRKSKLERPVHLDLPKNSPFSDPTTSQVDQVDQIEEKAVNE